ncbi:hypothetical protein RV134_250088 [Roseovarius sp. EC-HK134]|nr:hypothetical protein RV420_280068 [Roseovarius sp. EC-SD190]VVT05540.1 hypothetical protein RV134_250088 [Roseovarius sp. EC-HK134]
MLRRNLERPTEKVQCLIMLTLLDVGQRRLSEATLHFAQPKTGCTCIRGSIPLLVGRKPRVG